MRVFAISLFFICGLNHYVFSQQNSDTLSTTATLQEVVIRSVQARAKDPVTFTNLTKKEISNNNFGQDLPFLLNQSPSTVVYSDAGTGIGYTGIRIRGTDPARTNLTVNGIPINDAESHGTFLVNMPDMASSINQIQVQRGVGTSTNGAGAFGASINIQTDDLQRNPFAEAALSYGSFNTQKYTAKAGTGLLSNNWSVDVRLSKIASDGFIDRASSDLKSFFVSSAYHGKKSLLKLNVFSGKEITYQSWYGVSEDKLKLGERTYNEYTYPNQVDHYQQDHYQLFYTYALSNRLKAHVGMHYTYGRGYYEEYRDDESFSTYKLNDTLISGPDTITQGDFIRRRWLDNDFYGVVASVVYEHPRWSVIAGGGLNRYEGRHFGELIWAEYSQGSAINDRFYTGNSDKRDGNIYSKVNYNLTKNIQVFVDLQYRHIQYRLLGEDLNNGVYLPYDFDLTYSFFNPKAGITYSLNPTTSLYAYAGIANKEPIRNDIIQAGINSLPRPERLYNYELGFSKNWNKSALQVNLYYMDYKDQLIATGAVNDVGAYNRVNVAGSYRAGVELSGGLQLTKHLRWVGNATWSQNRIVSFTEYLSDWDTYIHIPIEHKNTTIAFSPDWVAASQFQFTVFKNIQLDIMSKYVGEQYLDNTENDARKLDAFLVNDLQIRWGKNTTRIFKRIEAAIRLNNVLDTEYEPNGYTYSGRTGGVRYDYNYYYPQAGRNVMVSLTLSF